MSMLESEIQEGMNDSVVEVAHTASLGFLETRHSTDDVVKYLGDV